MKGGLLTFAAAQREIGIAGPGGRRLKRYVLRREKQIGKQIAIRTGTRRVTYKVSIAALRKHCPALFTDSNALEREFKKHLKAIDDKIQERVIDHISEHVDPKIDELWQRDEIIANNVNQLARRIDIILGQQ